MSFTLSKIDELRSAGLFSTFSVTPSCSINLRWSRVSFVGVSTRTWVVQIALAATARIGQSPALKAKHGAALRALWNFKFFFAVQPRHLQFRTESRLRDAQGNRAIQVRASRSKN